LYKPAIASLKNCPLPTKGYYWIIIPHPIMNQYTISRVYTRDSVTNKAFIQHYNVVTELFHSYQLKNTRRNLASKSSSKYSSTIDTSAIIKCQGCHLQNTQQLTEVNQRAHRNFRSLPTCIFRQALDNALLLSVKSH